MLMLVALSVSTVLAMAVLAQRCEANPLYLDGWLAFSGHRQQQQQPKWERVMRSPLPTTRTSI
ncbi:hypothetical protein TYRP_019063 [Tyrophagus putrescentiae]|nr:hypothetical protein TYRP_019063 [Tyrophagus putrescentiae]